MAKLLRIYALTILLGILTGTVGSLFQLGISRLDRLLTVAFHYLNTVHWPVALISAVVSMLMVSLSYFLIRRFAPEGAGSGVQEIEGVLLHQRPIYWRRLLPTKFFASILAISAKMVVGREGPTIQMGGNLGEMLGELFNIPRKRRDVLIAAGAAAGLSTAFNAPLAGVLFIIEEMRYSFNYSFTNFKIVAICTVMATITTQILLGSQAAISMDIYLLPSLSSLRLFFLFGILVGFAGLLFNLTLMAFLNHIDQLKPWIRTLYVPLVGALVGYLAYLYPDTMGGGYGIIHDSLNISKPLFILCFLFLVRFVMTMICYSTGVPGGVFAPILALGTLLGVACFHLFGIFTINSSLQPGMFAVAGMGALFSAVVRAPLTGVVLVVEMTQNYSLILPLMVSCLTSTAIMQLAKNEPLYTQLLRRTLQKQGNSLRHLE